MSGNRDQEDFWSGPSGQSWVRHEAAQDQLLAPVADLVMELAGISSGEAVVDIGCGAGALSALAADRVGASGRVLATDISKPLLTRAADRLAEFPQVSTRLADAQTTDWPEGPFDHAVSRFGVMFFADPEAAFANIARGLRQGGRMTFASWAPAKVNPYWSEAAAIAVRHLGQPPRIEQDTPGPMGLADIDLTERRFRDAGLGDVACRPVDTHLVFDGNAQTAAALAINIGPAARVINHFDATRAHKEAIQSDLTRWLQGFEAEGQVRIPACINMITATAP